MSRRCDREGVAWPPPVYGPPRPGRRCGWCDRTDVAFGYDHLPPACPDHEAERLRTLDAIEALHTDGKRWTKRCAPEASARRIYDAGEAFVRGSAADDGWTMWPQAQRRNAAASVTAPDAARERGR